MWGVIPQFTPIDEDGVKAWHRVGNWAITGAVFD